MTVHEKDRALTPARFNEARFDYSRFSVYNPANQVLFVRSSGTWRTLIRRVANWNVDKNTTTGLRVPEYDDQEIYGMLVEETGNLTVLPAGVSIKQDAVLITLDGVDIMDQIKDEEPLKYFEVTATEEHTDSFKGGLAYRVVHLHRLELYKEG